MQNRQQSLAAHRSAVDQAKSALQSVANIVEDLLEQNEVLTKEVSITQKAL
jgi:hypothetical protein